MHIKINIIDYQSLTTELQYYKALNILNKRCIEVKKNFPLEKHSQTNPNLL